MKRGEIWWAGLPEPLGSEPGKRRPVVIIQANAFNDSRIGTVVVAAITSNLERAGAPGNVRLSRRDSGLPSVSIVNVSQVATIDRSLLLRRVRALGSRVVDSIDDGLRLVLALPG